MMKLVVRQNRKLSEDIIRLFVKREEQEVQKIIFLSLIFMKQAVTQDREVAVVSLIKKKN